MPVQVLATTKTYNSKKPCKRCGTTLRYMAARNCVECSRHHCRDYYAAHPQKFEAYKARRYEKKRLARARAAQLRRMGRPVTTSRKPSKVLAFTMRGRPVRLKHKTLKPIIVREAMDTIEMKSAPLPIFGTMGIVETPDAIKIGGGNGTLQEIYLLALLKRDAVIWHKRALAVGHVAENADEPDDPVVHYANRTTDRAFTRKRPNKKELREQQRAADEARRAKFAAERHPFIRAFDPATAIIIAKPKPPKPPRIAQPPKPRIPKPPKPPKPRKPKSQSLSPPSSPRALAMAAGLKTYVREAPCPKCGNRVFRVSNYMCAECDKSRKRIR